MDRYYSAEEILDLIKDGWEKEPEEINQLIDFIENVNMTKPERYKVINSDDANLLYSMQGEYT